MEDNSDVGGSSGEENNFIMDIITESDYKRTQGGKYKADKGQYRVNLSADLTKKGTSFIIL